MDEQPLRLELSPAEWLIQRKQYIREEDGLYESLFALTNGIVGVRATVDFEAGGGSPGCFFSDLYGAALAVRSELVNALNFGYWRISIEGLPLSPANATHVQFLQALDLYRAAVSTRMVLCDQQGRITEVSVYTLLPSHAPDLMLTIFNIEAINHASKIELHSGIDWQRGNGYMGGCDPAVQLHHLRTEKVRSAKGHLGVCAANRGTEQYVAAVTRHSFQTGESVPSMSNRQLVDVISLSSVESKRWTLVRISAFGTGSDPVELIDRCERRAGEASSLGASALLTEHRASWRARWDEAEVRLDGPVEDVEAFRFGIFHLLQAPARQAQSANIAARGLTSEYHSGHFFFNTELYLVPYYALTEPAVARALIMHRVSTLNAAREHAQATGFEGARYPEEADLEGHPAAPRLIHDPFTGQVSEEWSSVEVMHLSADVLYALSRYIEATGDKTFISGAVLEMIIDIARYCASLMKYDAEVEGRGALGVMCFDEFHYHVNHHYSTNYLMRWALRWISETLDALLRDSDETETLHLEQTLESIGAGKSARQSWSNIAHEIYLPPDERGVCPQFNGYLSLPDQLASHSPHHRLPKISETDQQRMDALLPFETRLIKQADIILLMALFPDSFERQTLDANYEFYDPRTVHASSLSMTPHSSVAAQLGKMDAARHYLLAALRYNLDFKPRNDYLNGIHLAGFAGAWNALVEGFLGFRSRPDGISFNPKLPREWSGVRLRMVWHRYKIAIEVTHEIITIKRLAGTVQSIAVRVGSITEQLSAQNDAVTFKLGRN